MLAKLKYLKEEEKTLQDIERVVAEQVTRLQQEELYLRSLLRDPIQDGVSLPTFELPSSSHKKPELSFPKPESLDDNMVNTVPLVDLQLTSHNSLHQNDHMVKNVEEEVEEEVEEDENDEVGMEIEDCASQEDEEEINRDLLKLMAQMQRQDACDEDDEEDY